MNSELTFSDRVVLLRKAMGLSQEEFAAKMHIGRSYLSQIEKGRAPSLMLMDLFKRLEDEWRLKAPQGARSKLKAARDAKGMTQAEFAKKIGYPDVGTYIGIEEGRSQMGEKMIRKAAKILGIDVSELMDGSDHPPERGAVYGDFGTIPDLKVPEGMKAKRVPLVAMAECGSADAWTDDGYAREGVTVIDCEDPRAVAVRLNGDSMLPNYAPGDVAVVYPSFEPYNDDLVIAKLNAAHGEDVMFKIYQKSGDRVILGSYNPSYSALTFPVSAFEWIRVVDQVIKKVRKRRR